MAWWHFQFVYQPRDAFNSGLELSSSAYRQSLKMCTDRPANIKGNMQSASGQHNQHFNKNLHKTVHLSMTMHRCWMNNIHLGFFDCWTSAPWTADQALDLLAGSDPSRHISLSSLTCLKTRRIASFSIYRPSITICRICKQFRNCCSGLLPLLQYSTWSSDRRNDDEYLAWWSPIYGMLNNCFENEIVVLKLMKVSSAECCL